MRRFTVALFLSFALHIAVLALLQAGRTESAPREIMRISLNGLPGGGGGGGGDVGGSGGDEPVSSVTSEALQLPQLMESAVAAATVSHGLTSIPESTPVALPDRAPVPEQKPAPAHQVQTSPPSPAPKQSTQPKTNEPNPKKAPAQTVKKSTGKSSNTQKNKAPKDAIKSTPNPVGSGGGSGGGIGTGSGTGSGIGSGSGSGIGSGTGPVIDATRLRVTKKVPAEYPMISRKRKDQGTVVLILNIRSGRVTKADIEKSSGHSALDESAKKAVSAWEFDISDYGESISARISFVFSLTN